MPSPTAPTLMDTGYDPPTGATIVVGAGGNLQTALNSANPGDTITLNAGSTYTGNFTLPAKSGSEYIHVRSSASLSPEGTRITPSNAVAFPKIVTSNASPAIQANAASSYYRFINIEFTSGSTPVSGGLIQLGTGLESDANNFPHHIILDRCYIHGSAANGGRRGVMFSGDYQAVIDSHISDFKEVGADTQAICGWTGYGPYKIANNHLEAAGENVMFGGADTAVSNLSPSDIEIRGNNFFKPLTWKIGDPSYLGTAWSVKNLLELKHAVRVLITDNEFENCWTHEQTGTAIVFTPRNQNGGNTWAILSDITFTENSIRSVEEGMTVIGSDSDNPSQTSARILISRNLFYDVTRAVDPRLFLIGRGVIDLEIDHNTANHAGYIMYAVSSPQVRFIFTNNIVKHNQYGVMGDGFASGNSTLNQYFPGAVFQKNVIALVTPNGEEITSASYPADNFFPQTFNDIGFVDLTNNADLRLLDSSPYHNASTEGIDIGADILWGNALVEEGVGAGGVFPGPVFPGGVFPGPVFPGTGGAGEGELEPVPIGSARHVMAGPIRQTPNADLYILGSAFAAAEN